MYVTLFIYLPFEVKCEIFYSQQIIINNYKLILW